MNQALLAIGYLLKGINGIYEYHSAATQDVQHYRQSLLANISNNIKEVKDQWLQLADSSVACYHTYQMMVKELTYFGTVLKEIALGTVPIYPSDIPNSQQLAESAERCRSLLQEGEDHCIVFKQVSLSPLSRSIRSVEGAFFWISHFGPDDEKAIVPYDEFYSKLYNTAPTVVGPAADLIRLAFVPVPSKTGQDKVSCFAWSTFLSFYYRSPQDFVQSTCSIFPDQHASLPDFVEDLKGILLHPVPPQNGNVVSQFLPSSPSQYRNQPKRDASEREQIDEYDSGQSSKGAQKAGNMDEYDGGQASKSKSANNERSMDEYDSEQPSSEKKVEKMNNERNMDEYDGVQSLSNKHEIHSGKVHNNVASQPKSPITTPLPSGNLNNFNIMVSTAVEDFVKTVNLQWLHLQLLSNRDAGNMLQKYGNGSGSFLFHPVANVQHAIALSFVQDDNSVVHALVHSTKKAFQDPITLPSWANKVPLTAKGVTSSPQLPRKDPISPKESDNIDNETLFANVLCDGELAVNASGKDAKPTWKPAYYVLFSHGHLNWFKNKKEFTSKRKEASKGFIRVMESLKNVGPKHMDSAEFVFEIETTDNKKYTFRVDSYKELNSWLEALYPFQIGNKAAQ